MRILITTLPKNLREAKVDTHGKELFSSLRKQYGFKNKYMQGIK